MSNRKVFLFLIVTFLTVALNAQSLSLADFRLDTTGFIPEGTVQPQFITTGTLAERFVPAHWITFRTRFSVQIADTALFFHPLPESNTPGSLYFDGAAIDLPALLDSPLNFSLFTGYFDNPSSGSLLRDLLKTEIIPAEFHSKPAGMVFSPESEISGTGIAMTTVPFNKNLVLALYGYWNTLTGSKAYSSYDLRFGGATGLLRFNTFGGVSVKMDSGATTLRGGITALFGAGSGNELYTEIGIKSFTYGDAGIDRNMYLLFEPRIHWEKADLSLSFFSSPVFPTNIPASLAPNSESNYIGANILAGFGSIQEQKMRGGISVMGSINPEDPSNLTPFSFSVSPFYSILISDFLFDITAVIKPLMIDNPYSIVELRISLKAVY